MERDFECSVHNYSEEGIFLELPEGIEADLFAESTDPVIYFPLYKDTGLPSVPKGKIIRYFTAEEGNYLAVRFLDFME